MSDLVPFNYVGREVRSLLLDGAPWFVAADVCAVLGYANGRAAVEQHVPEKHRGSVAIHDGTPGNPNRALISEAGLYRLIIPKGLGELHRLMGGSRPLADTQLALVVSA